MHKKPSRQGARAGRLGFPRAALDTAPALLYDDIALFSQREIRLGKGQKYLMIRKWIAALLSLALLFSTSSALASAEVHRTGDETVPKIAITVDDCYDLAILAQILDLCDQYKVHVTFYPVGCNIKAEDGDLWRRVVESGHEIGNHSFNHSSMSNMKEQKVYNQLVKMENALSEALGYDYYVATFRPPFGAAGKAPYRRLLERFGYNDIILWSVSQTNAQKALKSVKNGSILLYHTKKKDYECLTELIPQLLDAGYGPVTVSELLGLEPVEREREK